MYGGLFGDLPAAKAKAVGNKKDPNDVPSDTAADKASDVSTNPVDADTTGKVVGPLVRTAVTATVPPVASLFPRFVPPQAARKRQQPQAKPTMIRKRPLEESDLTRQAPPVEAISAVQHKNK